MSTAGKEKVPPTGGKERERRERQGIPEVELRGGGPQSGDHVKVVNGAAAGQRGMVVSVDTETGICVILTDAHKEELRVFTRDLSESHETPGTESSSDTCAPNAQYASFFPLTVACKLPCTNEYTDTAFACGLQT